MHSNITQIARWWIDKALISNKYTASDLSINLSQSQQLDTSSVHCNSYPFDIVPLNPITSLNDPNLSSQMLSHLNTQGSYISSTSIIPNQNPSHISHENQTNNNNSPTSYTTTLEGIKSSCNSHRFTSSSLKRGDGCKTGTEFLQYCLIHKKRQIINISQII
jgi:hypothetical protein